VFAQLYAIQENESRLTQLIHMISKDIVVTHLTLTIRYTDWWWWDLNQPLAFSRRSIGMIRLPPTVQDFNLELETRNGKKAELDALITEIETWKIGDMLLAWEEKVYASLPQFVYSGKTELSWITSSRQGMTKPPRDIIPTILHHYPAANNTPQLEDDKMMLWVVKLKWLQQKPVL
jgi:hypothetical protein